MATVAAAREAYRLGLGAQASVLIADGRAGAPTPGQAVALGALEALVVMWLEHRIVDGAALAWRALADAEILARTAGGAAHLGAEDRVAFRDALLAAFDAAIQRRCGGVSGRGAGHRQAIGPLNLAATLQAGLLAPTQACP